MVTVTKYGKYLRIRTSETSDCGSDRSGYNLIHIDEFTQIHLNVCKYTEEGVSSFEYSVYAHPMSRVDFDNYNEAIDYYSSLEKALTSD